MENLMKVSWRHNYKQTERSGEVGHAPGYVHCRSGQKDFGLDKKRIQQRLCPEIFGYWMLCLTPAPLNHHLVNITPWYAKPPGFVCMKNGVKRSTSRTCGAPTERWMTFLSQSEDVERWPGGHVSARCFWSRTQWPYLTKRSSIPMVRCHRWLSFEVAHKCDEQL